MLFHFEGGATESCAALELTLDFKSTLLPLPPLTRVPVTCTLKMRTSVFIQGPVAWLKLIMLSLTVFCIDTEGVLTSAARHLIGDSEQLLLLMSEPIPRFFEGNLHQARTGERPLHLLHPGQNRWNDAINNLLVTPYFHQSVYAETALSYYSVSARIQQAIADHLNTQSRTFYYLGENIYLTKAGPETQQARMFFEDRDRFTESGANSAILVWRKDPFTRADPELIVAVAFRSPASPNPMSWTPSPMYQLRSLPAYKLVPSTLTQALYRFDDYQRFRSLVPQDRLPS